MDLGGWARVPRALPLPRKAGLGPPLPPAAILSQPLERRALSGFCSPCPAIADRFPGTLGPGRCAAHHWLLWPEAGILGSHGLVCERGCREVGSSPLTCGHVGVIQCQSQGGAARARLRGRRAFFPLFFVTMVYSWWRWEATAGAASGGEQEQVLTRAPSTLCLSLSPMAGGSWISTSLLGIASYPGLSGFGPWGGGGWSTAGPWGGNPT